MLLRKLDSLFGQQSFHSSSHEPKMLTMIGMVHVALEGLAPQQRQLTKTPKSQPSGETVPRAGTHSPHVHVAKPRVAHEYINAQLVAFHGSELVLLRLLQQDEGAATERHRNQ